MLYGGAIGATVVAGAIATWLILTAGDGIAGISPFGLAPGGASDDESLRVLGAALVVLTALWFSALAASRLELRTDERERPTRVG